MTDQDLEPVNIEKIFSEFSDHSIAELMLTIKELREQRDHEQKVNGASTVLSGDSDICIDCEAVKEQDED